ncbi:unnamed protein product [Paramecium sonneborni]|uniref:Uncharacterized protein n=1 Tax=Paramecium sonneborni TaxID=65129 RepID=A0A8S1QSY8_9CILI|nr:unnamed protein product [Paramecium sonneborni]
MDFQQILLDYHVQLAVVIQFGQLEERINIQKGIKILVQEQFVGTISEGKSFGIQMVHYQHTNRWLNGQFINL